MKAARASREKQFSQNEMDQFHTDVMKKVSSLPARGAGMPFAGLALTAVFALSVIGAAVFYLNRVPVEKMESTPVKADVRLVTPPIVSPVVTEIVDRMNTPAVPSQVPAPLMKRETETQAPAAGVKEDELLEEIEALKELGVWTEEDEEEAGIPVEAAFLELANYVSDNQSSVAMPGAAAGS